MLRSSVIDRTATERVPRDTALRVVRFSGGHRHNSLYERYVVMSGWGRAGVSLHAHCGDVAPTEQVCALLRNARDRANNRRIAEEFGPRHAFELICMRRTRDVQE